jgi:site-specific recombinase XerD
MSQQEDNLMRFLVCRLRYYCYWKDLLKNKMRRSIDEFKAKGAFEKDWGPMDLCHSFVVNFLKRGGSLKELQYVIGHERVFQTKQHYGSIEPI